MNRFVLASFLALSGCAAQGQSPQATAPAVTPTATDQVQQLTWSIGQEFPHDTGAFTEGLLWKDGFFYESTGLEGKSDVRKVDPASGQVLQRKSLAPQYFGEGLAFIDKQFYNLTWQSKVGFIYDEKFKPLGHFAYTNQGWGLTTDGERLLQSDGTDVLTWRNPKNFAKTGEIDVTRDGLPLDNLNELEWIKGYIWANVWMTDDVVVIDPKDGKVVAQMDLSRLLPEVNRSGGDNVLNGIAYDAKSDRIYFTGKNWPKLFWLRVENVPHQP